MSYNIVIAKRAKRELRSLPVKMQERIAEDIGLLAYDPAAFQLDVKSLTNDLEARYRLRVRNYRIKFDRDDKLKTIFIIRVAHRKDAYR